MAQQTNTRFALAVHVLTLLAREPDAMHSSAVLAASAGSNPVHVRRVLGQLRRAGLVASRPGPAGGWLITAELEAISLCDVWGAVDRDGRVLGLHSASPDCAVGQLIQAELGRVERDAAAALTAELERRSLADVVRATAGVAAGAPSA